MNPLSVIMHSDRFNSRMFSEKDNNMMSFQEPTSENESEISETLTEGDED